MRCRVVITSSPARFDAIVIGAGQRGRDDAGRVGGPSGRTLAAAAVHRDRDIRCVHGQSGRGPRVASRDGARRGGVYANLRVQRDDRAAPRTMGTLGPGGQRRAAVRNRGAVSVTSRSAGCRTVAAAGVSPHRRCLARPNGVARAGSFAPRTVGRRAVLARRQPRGAPLLPACAGDVGAVPCRAQCGRRPPIVRVTCSA